MPCHLTPIKNPMMFYKGNKEGSPTLCQEKLKEGAALSLRWSRKGLGGEKPFGGFYMGETWKPLSCPEQWGHDTPPSSTEVAPDSGISATRSLRSLDSPFLCPAYGLPFPTAT